MNDDCIAKMLNYSAVTSDHVGLADSLIRGHSCIVRSLLTTAGGSIDAMHVSIVFNYTSIPFSITSSACNLQDMRKN
jgi:hypothetical protein